jgi:hypothetical protein
MEQILISIKNKEKAKLLLELLKSLDFVEEVESHIQADEINNSVAASEDFFALAGLWSGREITLDSLRQKAWPRQHGSV